MELLESIKPPPPEAALMGVGVGERAKSGGQSSGWEGKDHRDGGTAEGAREAAHRSQARHPGSRGFLIRLSTFPEGTWTAGRLERLERQASEQKFRLIYMGPTVVEIELIIAARRRAGVSRPTAGAIIAVTHHAERFLGRIFA